MSNDDVTYTSGSPYEIKTTVTWNIPPWPHGQRWFVRLDEWHHAHQPPVLRTAWFWLWRPLCNYTDWWYRRL